MQTFDDFDLLLIAFFCWFLAICVVGVAIDIYYTEYKRKKLKKPTRVTVNIRNPRKERYL